MRGLTIHEPMRGLHPHRNEPRLQPTLGSFAPADLLPSLGMECHIPNRTRPLLPVLISGSRLTSAAVLGNVDLGRLGPDTHLGRDPHHIGKFPGFQTIPEFGRVSVAGIRHYDSVRQSPTADLVYHLQSSLVSGKVLCEKTQALSQE